MKIAILTDLLNYDPAYSISTAVKNQLLMLQMRGYDPVLFVKEGYDDSFRQYGSPRTIQINQGKCDNVVRLDNDTEAEIEHIYNELTNTIQGFDAVICHDLIYQPAQWKMHVAARRFAIENPDTKWLHFVHSATNMNTASQTGHYQKELIGKFPHSVLAVFHTEERIRKAGLYGYEVDQTAIVPNAYDIAEFYESLTKKVIADNKLWQTDMIAVYPCRLDRGKQPHIVIEIFSHLNEMGFYAPVIIADFHSTGGDKEIYRSELRKMAGTKTPVIFMSDYEPYHVPHKVITELFDYGDILIHPSRSESDPLIIPEAAWARCGLVLNMDLRTFHNRGELIGGKFSANIDITTGQLGTTETSYSDRKGYMQGIANQIYYHMQNNPVLGGHARVRQERSLEAVSRHLVAALS